MGINIKSVLGELELIAEHSILLLDNDDIIEVALPVKAGSWIVKCMFTDDDNFKEQSVTTEIENDRNIILKLNKWYSSTWVENSTPYKFTSKGKTFEIYVKIRTTAIPGQNSRSVIINIWLKILTPPIAQV